MCPSLAFREVVLNITFLKNNFFYNVCHGIDPGSRRLRLLNVGTFPSTCSPSFLSRLCSSCGQYVTIFSSRMWSVVALQTSITIMFDQEHIGNIVFWEGGFQKGNLSTSTGHLEVGLNDM